MLFGPPPGQKNSDFEIEELGVITEVSVIIYITQITTKCKIEIKI